ncbi:hypothetical protein ACWTQZ_26165, partial [Escherichia coli]
TPPIPSPLVGQGFPPQQAKRAVVQVVREIHSAHDEYDAPTVEEIILEAILRARRERNAKGES